MDTFEFVSGDDGSLQYYHKCNICGSYIVVDHGSDEYDTPCICNHCNAHTGYISPHHFIEVNTDEWKAHDRYFKFLYRLENDKWFRYRNAVITKIRSFIPYVMYKAHKLFRKVK